MAKGDVVGVAAYVEDGRSVVRLQHDNGRDGEAPGDQVVFDTERGGWCSVKADAEVTEAERMTYRRNPVPGELLDPQPPQVPVELSPELIERGVTAKARAILNAPNGGPAKVGEYLAHHLGTTLIDRPMADRVAALLGVPAPKLEG